MKIKTQDLIGAQLDWAVAKCDGIEYHTEDYQQDGVLYILIDGLRHEQFLPMYSAAWDFGGPLLERERIDLVFEDGGRTDWVAYVSTTMGGDLVARGPTTLIAAMRAFVASKLGDEVEVPEALA